MQMKSPHTRPIKGLSKGTKIEAYGMSYYTDLVVVGPHKHGVEVTGTTVVGKSREPFEKGSCFNEKALVIVIK